MLPLRIASGSSNGRSASASSMAGPSAAMAAAAAARSPPPGRSRPMCTAISGSATGLAQPLSEAVPPEAMSPPLIRKPTSGAVILNFSIIAGAPNPTFQPSGCSLAAMRARRLASCSVMPRAMRGSSQGAAMSVLALLAFRHLVAGRFDGAGAHPAPQQHHILVGGVVEAMPAAARTVNHVALAGRLQALAGDDVPLALEHDEELVAIRVQVPLVAGTGPQHRPADDMVGAGRFLVDQELHVHVDPAVLALQAFHLRYALEVGAVHLAHFDWPPRRR